MSYEYRVDSENRSRRRNRDWYRQNLVWVLEQAKEHQTRNIDTSIAMAKELNALMDAPRPKPAVVPRHDAKLPDSDVMMKPIEPEVLDILYGGTEKYVDRKYLKARYKKAPEDKFYSRVQTSWDYGWRQSDSRQRARDFNYGRCALLRETFYRKNNLAPDPPTYSQPSTGEFSICSQYSCYFG